MEAKGDLDLLCLAFLFKLSLAFCVKYLPGCRCGNFDEAGCQNARCGARVQVAYRFEELIKSWGGGQDVGDVRVQWAGRVGWFVRGVIFHVPNFFMLAG